MEPEFPIEFVVLGTPVSLQSGNSRARDEWKELVRASSAEILPDMHFANTGPIAVTLYYYPEDQMDGDVDNIVKLILDAMSGYIFVDDRQVERVVVQKFERDRVFSFTNPTETLTNCLFGEKPALYVKVSDDPHEEFYT